MNPASFPNLFDNAPGLVVVLAGPDHVIAYANPAYAEFAGREDLVGKRYRDARQGPSMQATIDRLDQVFRSGEPFIGRALPSTIRRSDGASEVRYFDYVYQPLAGADGQVEGIIGQAQDITERVLARQALAVSEERLALAVRAGAIGVWEWRLDTNEMIYSAEARAICGFGPDEPVTLDMVMAVTHPEDLPRTQAQSARARDPAVRDAAPYEYRVVRPDGGQRWVLAHGRAVFEDSSGTSVATRYVGTILDITERKQAEQAHLASEQRLALALQAGRMAIWEVDDDDNLKVSPELARMLGLAPERTSLKLAELAANFRPEDLKAIAAASERARALKEPFFQVEFLYRLPDGESRWFESRAEALGRGPDGSAGAIGVVMDITERKQAEERTVLLAHEVDHRARNLMSVIQGTVRLSRADSAQELREGLSGRINALARAHQLLAESRWRGADLRRLIQEELLPFCLGDERRCEISGAEVALPASGAQALAMAVHELATNAAKYGALSIAGGVVAVDWSVDEDRLTIRWRERGGPAVSPPSTQGFGTTLLSRALAGVPGGKTQLDWRPNGLQADLELRLQPAPEAPSR